MWGQGIHIGNVKRNGSLIKSIGGQSQGLVPMLKVFNDTARYINQGGKRSVHLLCIRTLARRYL